LKAAHDKKASTEGYSYGIIPDVTHPLGNPTAIAREVEMAKK